MLNLKEFSRIRNEIHSLDLKREEIIHTSREIITVSKQIIYACQRDDLDKAESLVKEIKSKVDKLRKMNFRVDTNINSVAFQEYVEAISFFEFVRHGRIPTKGSLKVSAEDYLSGLCDLTGELVRKAVNDVINKINDEAKLIKE